MTQPTEALASISASGSTARPDGSDRPILLTSALAGIVYLLTVFLTPPDGPAVAVATAPQIRSYLAANAAALRIATAAGVLGLVAFLIFVTSLARLVRNRLPVSMLADVVLTAGILLAGLYLLTVATTSMTLLLPGLIDTDPSAVDDAVLRGWYGLTGFTHFLGDLQMAPLALLLTGFSIAALRGRLLPRWLGVTGLALAGCAVLGLVGIATAWSPLYPLWFIALFGWVLWTLLTSITFGLRWRRLRQ